jgi:hypothetical protein
MPNPNAIISTFVALEQPLDPTLEMLRTGERISVELDDERRVQLEPADPRSSGFARVLDGLSKQMLPVYLEIDPDTDAISRLLIPYVARVGEIGYEAEGALRVTLDPSHAVHLLRFDNPDFAELERELRGALRAAQPVILVDDDAHQIIGVRAFTPDPVRPRPPLPPFPYPSFPPAPIPDYRDLIRRLRDWIRAILTWPWWWWSECVSMETAQRAFDSMAATTCDPATIPPPCIPFLYPDDGCWARAHEMCRQMINSGLSPRKVWIDCSPGHVLYVNTRNNPRCFVTWGWHVAPSLCVRYFSFPFVLPRTKRMVIDPSLFTTPVREATWKGVQGDPNAVLTRTSADQFWHGGGPDPTYSNTNYYLGVYRLELQNRSVQHGPPPYAVCP